MVEENNRHRKMVRVRR